MGGWLIGFQFADYSDSLREPVRALREKWPALHDADAYTVCALRSAEFSEHQEGPKDEVNIRPSGSEAKLPRPSVTVDNYSSSWIAEKTLAEFKKMWPEVLHRK